MSMQFVSVVREGLSPQTRHQGQRRVERRCLTDKSLDPALALKVSATVENAARSSVSMHMLGPADVAGVDPRVVLRTDPPAVPRRSTRRCSPDGVRCTRTAVDVHAARRRAAIASAPGSRWWSAVRRRGQSPLDVEPDAGHGRLPVLTVNGAEDLPPIDETWAWAHAQVVTGVRRRPTAARPTALVATIRRHVQPAALSAQARSEGTALRRVRRSHVRSGSDGRPWRKPPDHPRIRRGADGQVPAAPARLLHWEFFTGEAGNFEAGGAAAASGRCAPPKSGRVVDASNPGRRSWFRTTTPPRCPLAGALRPERCQIAPYTGPAVAGYEQLALLVKWSRPRGSAVSGRQRALYAGKHVGVLRHAAAAPPWVHELNTDPRHRIAAALGARIVRDNQEALMRSAWEQAGDIEEANRRLRRARLGRAASTRIVAKHIEPLDDVDRLRVLAPSFGRLGLPQTNRLVSGLIDESRVPNRLLTTAFTALTRPNGRIGRQFELRQHTRPELVSAIDDDNIVIDRGDVGRPGGLVTLDGVVGVLEAARDSLAEGGDRVPVTTGTVTPTEPGALRVDASAVGEGRRATRRADHGPRRHARRWNDDRARRARAPERRRRPAHGTRSLDRRASRALTGKIEFTAGSRTVDVTDAHTRALWLTSSNRSMRRTQSNRLLSTWTRLPRGS